MQTGNKKKQKHNLILIQPSSEMSASFDRNVLFNSALRSLLVQIGRCYATEKKCKLPKLVSCSCSFPELISILSVTEDLLISLHTLFPSCAVATLDLLDHKSVSLVTSPSKRKVYSCTGSSGTPYLISYTGFTCTCSNYCNFVSCENMWCKHLLALQLAIAMEQVQHREVNEDIMNSMLSELAMVD